MGPAISEGSFKSTKTIYHRTCLAMESLFCFHSLNGECATCVYLQLALVPALRAAPSQQINLQCSNHI